MKKQLTTFLTLVLLGSAGVEAQVCSTCNYASAPRRAPQRTTQSYQCTTRDPYCYSCEQVCPDECHFFIGAEGLWWTACENDLDFAVDFNANETEILGSGSTHFADYDWKWGVRGWIGWNWCCGWDSTLSYTWFRTEGTNIIDRQDEVDQYVKASLLHPNTGATDATRATADLELKYQAADLLFGRTVTYCENSLVIHPFVGFHGIWIEQDQEYLYEGGDFVSTPADFIGGIFATPARVTWESKLKGAGLKGGVDMNFRWSSGFGIYGSASGSVLAAKTDVEHLQEFLDADGVVTTTDIYLKEDQCIGVPGLHLQGGFNYSWACGECVMVKFHVLYEFNSYFNTPHIRRYSYNNEGVSSSGTSGNITMNGITFGGEIFF